MKLAILALLSSVALSSIASADGIPFDSATGRVTELHDRLKLTEAQRAEYVAQRRLTLTPEQRQRLTKRCPTFPAVIDEVLSHRYGDCTCCVGRPYAIMLPGDSAVAIPRSELSFVSRYGVRPRPTFEAPAPTKRPSAWSRFWSSVRRPDSKSPQPLTKLFSIPRNAAEPGC